jgi:hypothetical protein
MISGPFASLTAPLRDKRRGRERPQRRSEALTATNRGTAGMDGLDDLGVVDAFDVTGPCLLDRAADVSAQTRQLDHVPGELLDRGGVAGWPARPPETTLWQGAENGMAGRHDPWHTSRAGASLPLSTTTGGARRRGRRSGRMEGGAELRRLSTRRAVRSSRTVQSRREPARRTHAKTWGPPRATRCESRATAPLVDHWPSKRRARSSADLASDCRWLPAVFGGFCRGRVVPCGSR